MVEILQKNIFVVKEHVGMFKAANNYDIYDPETGQIVMECREEHLGILTKLFRFTQYKRMTPFDIQVRTPDGQQIVRVTKGLSFLRANVTVLDEKDKTIGGFKQKLLSIGGAFTVLDINERPVCELKGKWTGWEFKFVSGNRELAQISKKWAGIGRELFTTADTYVLQIAESVPKDAVTRQLILAAVMCIDMVLKE